MAVGPPFYWIIVIFGPTMGATQALYATCLC